MWNWEHAKAFRQDKPEDITLPPFSRGLVLPLLMQSRREDGRGKSALVLSEPDSTNGTMRGGPPHAALFSSAPTARFALQWPSVHCGPSPVETPSIISVWTRLNLTRVARLMSGSEIQSGWKISTSSGAVLSCCIDHRGAGSRIVACCPLFLFQWPSVFPASFSQLWQETAVLSFLEENARRVSAVVFSAVGRMTFSLTACSSRTSVHWPSGRIFRVRSSWCIHSLGINGCRQNSTCRGFVTSKSFPLSIEATFKHACHGCFPCWIAWSTLFFPCFSFHHWILHCIYLFIGPDPCPSETPSSWFIGSDKRFEGHTSSEIIHLIKKIIIPDVCSMQQRQKLNKALPTVCGLAPSEKDETRRSVRERQISAKGRGRQRRIALWRTAIK